MLGIYPTVMKTHCVVGAMIICGGVGFSFSDRVLGIGGLDSWIDPVFGININEPALAGLFYGGYIMAAGVFWPIAYPSGAVGYGLGKVFGKAYGYRAIETYGAGYY